VHNFDSEKTSFSFCSGFAALQKKKKILVLFSNYKYRQKSLIQNQLALYGKISFCAIVLSKILTKID